MGSLACDQRADRLTTDRNPSHRPAERAVTGIQPQIFKAVRPTNGVPSGVIGRRPVQKVPARHDRRVDRDREPPFPAFPTRLQQLGVKTNNFRHSANTMRLSKRVMAIL